MTESRKHNLRRLQSLYHALIAAGGPTRARPRHDPAGQFRHFATPEAEQQAIEQAAQARQDGAPF